jgi:type IV secretion system protein VirB10
VRAGPSDHAQPSGQSDDPAVQARKQAWQSYYQQLATLEQSRQQDTANALKADTAPNGMTGVGAMSSTGGPSTGASSTGSETSGGAALSPAQSMPTQSAAFSGSPGYRLAPGGLGVGSGYPILPPAGPDPAGAHEKQNFMTQTGSLGQDDTLAATVRDPISPYLVTAGDVIPCVAEGGEDSDTPGQFVGRVSRNIYDSATGRFLLIPQNSNPHHLPRQQFDPDRRDARGGPGGLRRAARSGRYASVGKVRQRAPARRRQRRHPDQPGYRPEQQRL